MRLILSASDSARWQAGGQAQWDVEERILTWANDHQVREAVVVVLDTDELAFAFCVDETGGAQ